MSPLDLLAQVLTWSKRSVKYTDKPFFLKNHIYLCIYDNQTADKYFVQYSCWTML